MYFNDDYSLQTFIFIHFPKLVGKTPLLQLFKLYINKNYICIYTYIIIIIIIIIIIMLILSLRCHGSLIALRIYYAYAYYFYLSLFVFFIFSCLFVYLFMIFFKVLIPHKHRLIKIWLLKVGLELEKHFSETEISQLI